MAAAASTSACKAQDFYLRRQCSAALGQSIHTRHTRRMLYLYCNIQTSLYAVRHALLPVSTVRSYHAADARPFGQASCHLVAGQQTRCQSKGS
jgi:hypothetical protein